MKEVSEETRVMAEQVAEILNNTGKVETLAHCLMAMRLTGLIDAGSSAKLKKRVVKFFSAMPEDIAMPCVRSLITALTLATTFESAKEQGTLLELFALVEKQKDEQKNEQKKNDSPAGPPETLPNGPRC